MISPDMCPEAVGRRLLRLSQLRHLAVSLAGRRRRPVSHFGRFVETNEQGEILHQPVTVAETQPPYRVSPPPP